MENWSCSSAIVSSYNVVGHWINMQDHNCYVVALKEQFCIFFNVFYMLFSVSPKREALLQSCDLSNILEAYTSIIVTCNKYEMNNINYTSWAANGWQLMVWIRCTINRQKLNDRHNDTTNYIPWGDTWWYTKIFISCIILFSFMWKLSFLEKWKYFDNKNNWIHGIIMVKGFTR